MEQLLWIKKLALLEEAYVVDRLKQRNPKNEGEKSKCYVQCTQVSVV